MSSRGKSPYSNTPIGGRKPPRPDDKNYGKRITPQISRFIDEYLVDFNGVRAAKAANYSPRQAGTLAYQQLRKPIVQAELAKRARKLMEETGNTPENTVNKLAAMVFGDEPTEVLVSERPDGTVLFVRKKYARLDALEKLGKYHKLFLDRYEVDHTFSFEKAASMSDAQLMDLLARQNGHHHAR